MSALTRQSGSPFVAAQWRPEVTELLDEHHLAAISSSPRNRMHFAVALGQFLQGMRHAEVCTLYGQYITDLDSFCHQLERTISGPSLERRVDGQRGVTGLLRSRHVQRGRAASRFRYYIWHDADVLLKQDAPLFGRLADALAGVAAEAEYVCDDLLFIQRSVFVGGPLLGEYADNPAGQLRAWYPDLPGQEPFWQLVTGIERPAVMRYQIDMLSAGV